MSLTPFFPQSWQSKDVNFLLTQLSRNISAVCKHFPFLYTYSPSQVHPKMQVHLAHSNPANVTSSQLHYIPEKSLLAKPAIEITTGKLCSITRPPVGLRMMVRSWCCTERQSPIHPRAVPSRVGSPLPPFSPFGHLTEQNWNPTPWGCEWIRSFSRSPI